MGSQLASSSEQLTAFRQQSFPRSLALTGTLTFERLVPRSSLEGEQEIGHRFILE